MPQWGYPHQNRDKFEGQFPADFISEGLDQTRGWFYSQLAISTLLFSDEESTDADRPAKEIPHPFRNCIVSGLMLAEWWESPDGKQRFIHEEEARAKLGEKTSRKVGKMSKSLKNYPPPSEIFDEYGADALRWYFFANQPPWNSIIYSERSIKDSIPEFQLRLWNVYSFFVIYANIDGFDPAAEVTGEVGQLDADQLATAASYRPVARRSELDRWILSELASMAATVTSRMDKYDNYGACQEITHFVDALSNWYVRRSRDRFWGSDKRAADKLDAYWTLYECLLVVTKVVAPFVPFLAEVFWRNLAGIFGERATESVHLCDFPEGVSGQKDGELSYRMSMIRDIVSLGRSARMAEKLKVRQPLAKVEVILAADANRDWLAEHDALIAEELNVKQVEFTENADQYITYQVVPDFKRLGPRFGKQLPAVKKALAEADGNELFKQLEQFGVVDIELPGGEVTLDLVDVEIRLQAKEGWAAAGSAGCVVVLSTELTDDLVREGWVNDLVRAIQDLRKETGCEFTDRIELGVVTESDELAAAVEQFAEHIATETLAVGLSSRPVDGVEPHEAKIAGAAVGLYLKIAP